MPSGALCAPSIGKGLCLAFKGFVALAIAKTGQGDGVTAGSVANGGFHKTAKAPQSRQALRERQ